MVTLDTGFLEGTTAAFQKPVLGTVSGTGPVSADFCGMNSRAVTMTGRQAVLVHLTMLWAQTFQGMEWLSDEIMYSRSKLNMKRNI